MTGMTLLRPSLNAAQGSMLTGSIDMPTITDLFCGSGSDTSGAAIGCSVASEAVSPLVAAGGGVLIPLSVSALLQAPRPKTSTKARIADRILVIFILYSSIYLFQFFEYEYEYETLTRCRLTP
jgi:hypothetical protein